jgi:DNA-nicking Smr family endonuclease
VLNLKQAGEHCEALAPGTPARVLSDLKRGRLRPEVTLDVHGLTAPQAIRTLDSLLDGANDSDVRTLLVVHGRGLHSGPGGPVLGEAIVEHLTRLRATRVLALCSAPSRWGGAGALLIRLRRSI